MAEEGKDLGPEEHSIKVFLSGNSGNKEVRIYQIISKIKMSRTGLIQGIENRTDLSNMYYYVYI